MRRYDPYYDDRPEPEISYRLLSNKRVVTRKEHQCSVCKKEIPIGTIAYKHVALIEGDFVSEYLHSFYGGCYE